MTHSNIADRLVRMHDRCTDSEIDAGVAWYHRAKDVVEGLAKDYGLSTANVAAVIAALSPNVRWSTNVNAARTILDAWYNGDDEPPVPGYPANRTKAWKILQTGNTDHLSGPKVEAFAANLRGDLQYVTIDMWAMRAIGGGDTPKNKTSKK